MFDKTYVGADISPPGLDPRSGRRKALLVESRVKLPLSLIVPAGGRNSLIPKQLFPISAPNTSDLAFTFWDNAIDL